jgi:hypothetical protein
MENKQIMDKYVYDWLADMKITFERIADSLEIIAEAKRNSVLKNITLTEGDVTLNYGYDGENENLK